MKSIYWIYFFLIVLVGDIASILLENDWLQYLCKPLLMPALVGFFMSQVKSRTKDLAAWILSALFFSWAGDVLLMFVDQNENFFLAGLASFLLAHIFYIVFFHRVRIKEEVKPKIIWLLIVVGYYAGLIIWLSPLLGDMKLPVRVYGLVISFMFMLALHMLSIRNKQAGQYMMLGALLFVISDSVLAINKFYQPFEAAGVIIMITYGLAQWLIVKGAVKYINLIK